MRERMMVKPESEGNSDLFAMVRDAPGTPALDVCVLSGTQ